MGCLTALAASCGTGSTGTDDTYPQADLADTFVESPDADADWNETGSEVEPSDLTGGSEEDRSCFGKVYYRDKDGDKYGVLDEFVIVCPGDNVPEGYIVEKAAGWDCHGVTDESFTEKGQPCDGADMDSCPNGTGTCKADGTDVECVNETIDTCDGKECGADFCGGSCGQCTAHANSYCNSFVCDCKPNTCGTLGHDCGGPYDNGCGGWIDSCGACDGYPNSQCSDGTCECAPDTCISLEHECGGPFDDGCGAWTAYCGACANGYQCSASTHLCVCPSGVECAGTCCPVGQTCNGGVCSDDTFDPDGSYLLTPQVSYVCAYGLVNVSHATFTFNDTGTSLLVTPSPSDSNCCTMSSPTDSAIDGSFSVSCFCDGAGLCDEYYSLDGTFTDNETWEGTFTANFVGSCFGCSYQSWNLTGTKL